MDGPESTDDRARASARAAEQHVASTETTREPRFVNAARPPFRRVAASLLPAYAVCAPSTLRDRTVSGKSAPQRNRGSVAAERDDRAASPHERGAALLLAV
jgi:hypothetical protein